MVPTIVILSSIVNIGSNAMVIVKNVLSLSSTTNTYKYIVCMYMYSVIMSGGF